MNIEDAIKDPGKVFGTPEELIKRDDLSREEKIEVLRRWHADAQGQSDAEGGLLGGGAGPVMSERISSALAELGASPEPVQAPTNRI